MSADPTRPCRSCGKKLPVEASFCMACGKAQEDAPESPDESRSFALVDADEEPMTTTPEAAAPAVPAEEPAPLETIEFDDDGPGEAAETADDLPEAGGDTVRMPLSDVVKAWAEDAQPSATTEAEAEAPKVPLTGNPNFLIVALIVLAVAVGLAIILFV